MRTLLVPVVFGALVGGGALQTEYKAERAVRVTVSSITKMETTVNEMERDGETVPGRGGMSSRTEHDEVHVDTVLAAADGKPTKVRRHFVEVGGTSSMEAGDMSNERDLESPFQGVTLELSVDDDGAVEAKVVDGTEPEGDGALEGHQLALFLDGLLPAGAAEEGATWDIGSEAVLHALRLDVQGKLYAPPARPDGGGEGRGGGRRGGRGGRGGGAAFLGTSEWKGTGKLTDLEADKDGVTCAVIELELETSGEREVQGGFGGRGRVLAGPRANTTSWSAKLEGKLWFDVKARRPLALELEGSLRTETNLEMEREGSSMRMHSVQEGTLEYSVEVAEEAVEKESK